MRTIIQKKLAMIGVLPADLGSGPGLSRTQKFGYHLNRWLLGTRCELIEHLLLLCCAAQLPDAQRDKQCQNYRYCQQWEWPKNPS